MNIVELARAGLDFFAGLFGYARDRSALNNAADVKKAAIAAEEQRQIDKDREAVKNQDVNEIRKGLG